MFYDQQIYISAQLKSWQWILVLYFEQHLVQISSLSTGKVFIHAKVTKTHTESMSNTLASICPWLYLGSRGQVPPQSRSSSLSSQHLHSRLTSALHAVEVRLGDRGQYLHKRDSLLICLQQVPKVRCLWLLQVILHDYVCLFGSDIEGSTARHKTLVPR